MYHTLIKNIQIFGKTQFVKFFRKWYTEYMGVDLSKEIKFIAKDKYAYEVCQKPFPATSAIPQWWKDALPYDLNDKNFNKSKIMLENSHSNATFKKCTPMLDALGLGYIIPLWADVEIREENGFPLISWRTSREVFRLHDGTGVEILEGYGQSQFKFLNQWIPKLPKGYSLFVTHPIGYQNSPFRAIDAIIDYDKTTHVLEPPLLLKNGFEGIIEKGTPMIQVFPFKRDNWKSSFEYLDEGEFIINVDRDVKATIVNNYVKNFWSKKSFK
jgi:hypothetical protein